MEHITTIAEFGVIEQVKVRSYKGRGIGAVNKPSPLVPINKFPIKVPLSVLAELGYVRAYIVSCVRTFEDKVGSGNYKLWLPGMEKRFPFGSTTLSSHLSWLVANGYLTYFDPKLDPTNRWYKDAGYSRGTKVCGLATSPFLLLPVPRKVPKGRLGEYMVLARLLSSGRTHYDNICGSRFIAKCLGMNRGHVLHLLEELEHAGAISQKENLRTVNVKFTNHPKEASND